jgi:lipopolysaccharide transport system ATP-binding protein
VILGSGDLEYRSMKPAIRVENLSKQYWIGTCAQESYRTLRDTLANAATAPFRRLRGRRTDGGGPDRFRALKDVSFDVQPGEVVGIIGRNGAGKSTLLKILSRIVDPTEGRVEMRGRLNSLLEVGTGFHPELSGRENVYLNGSILGMSRSEIGRKFDEIVAFSEIEQFLDTPVKRYSSGMYVRLAFAVAAHLESEILIVDEVLAVGDADFQKKCVARMAECKTTGKTVLFVSHNMQSVVTLCDRAILLDKGSVKRDGAVGDVMQYYMSGALSANNGIFDLSAHPTRLGKGGAFIRSLRLRDSRGHTTAHFFTGQPLLADIDVFAPQLLEQPRFALAIEDSFGRRVFTLADYFTVPVLDSLCGQKCVRCTIPNLRLGAGRYLLSVSLATRAAGLIDSVDNVAWIDVDACNPYGNGEPYAKVYGPVIEASRWEVAV